MTCPLIRKQTMKRVGGRTAKLLLLMSETFWRVGTRHSTGERKRVGMAGACGRQTLDQTRGPRPLGYKFGRPGKHESSETHPLSLKYFGSTSRQDGDCLHNKTPDSRGVGMHTWC